MSPTNKPTQYLVGHALYDSKTILTHYGVSEYDLLRVVDAIRCYVESSGIVLKILNLSDVSDS